MPSIMGLKTSGAETKAAVSPEAPEDLEAQVTVALSWAARMRASVAASGTLDISVSLFSSTSASDPRTASATETGTDAAVVAPVWAATAGVTARERKPTRVPSGARTVAAARTARTPVRPIIPSGVWTTGRGATSSSVRISSVRIPSARGSSARGPPMAPGSTRGVRRDRRERGAGSAEAADPECSARSVLECSARSVRAGSGRAA